MFKSWSIPTVSSPPSSFTTIGLGIALLLGGVIITESVFAIPGIGRKLAERVIFELKEKVAAAGTAALAGFSGPVGGETEVVGALQALGYSAAEAREASQAALHDPSIGGTLEDRVKAALRTLLRE